MKPAPPVIRRVGTSDRCTLGILEGQPELLRQRVDRRPAPFPGAFGLEPYVADAAAPRPDRAADGAEIRSIGVLLIEPAGDVWRHADEGPERRRRLDAVLPAVQIGRASCRERV